MTITLGQATVPSNSTVPVYIVPPGTVNTTVFQPTMGGTPATVYIGTSANVSRVGGMPVPLSPVNAESFVSTPGVTIYATTGSATASSFSYIIIQGET